MCLFLVVVVVQFEVKPCHSTRATDLSANSASSGHADTTADQFGGTPAVTTGYTTTAQLWGLTPATTTGKWFRGVDLSAIHGDILYGDTFRSQWVSQLEESQPTMLKVDHLRISKDRG